MTGNSSGNQNNRLLSIIGRYKTTPWRGRYSLSRLFLNFYLLVMGSFVVIAFLAEPARLEQAALAAKSVGRPDADARLADLVERVAAGLSPGESS